MFLIERYQINISLVCERNCHISIGSIRPEKACLQGFRQNKLQTSLLSYRDKLEHCNFTCSKYTYNTFQKENNKGADQTAGKRRLVCACVVRKPPKTVFLASRPIFLWMDEVSLFVMEFQEPGERPL